MYRIYYTDPDTDFPHCVTYDELTTVLQRVNSLRDEGFTYVTMVSDYADMIGKPGAKGAGSEYVPQLLQD